MRSTERISEAAAERRPRGRPRAFNADDEAWAFDNGAKSDRSAQNLLYRKRAITRLRMIVVRRPDLTSRLSWLLDFRTGVAARPSVLTELGRVRPPRLFWLLADQVCREKPLSKEAEAMIRAARLTSGAGSRDVRNGQLRRGRSRI
jgi:hypothetical protein